MSIRTPPIIARTAICALPLLCLVTAASYACAQDDPAMPGTLEALPTDILKPGANLLYKDPETGETRLMPGFTQQMLEDLLKRSQLQQPSGLYDFVELRLIGRTDGEHVFLHADIRVEVLVENERVTVPVGFEELRLKSQQHSPRSATFWGKRDMSKRPGKSWILYGKGMHQLSLDLVGQIRTTTNGQQRFRLGVPIVATSSLELRFDDLVESAQVVNGIPPILTVDEESRSTELKAYGLAESTDIVWTPRPTKRARTVSIRATAPANMKLDLNTDPGALQMSQPLAISGGSVDELRIGLPDKLVVVSITGTDAAENSIVSDIEQTGDQWIIRFNAPITGPITLDYDLGLKNSDDLEAEFSDNVSVTLPDVQGATNVSGNLEVHVPNGMEVLFSESNTRRIRVDSRSDSRTRVTAYRLLSRSSRLDLKISETEAFYSVIPRVSFKSARQENTLEMTARFSVNMLRGSRIEMDMLWPGFLTQGWRISGDPTLITEASEGTITGYAPDESVDSFRLVFPERQSGQFDIELHAFRDLTSVEQSDGMIYLPDLPASTPHTTVVALIESDADSIILSRPGQETPFPVLPSSRWPEDMRGDETPMTAWLVDAPQDPVQIRIIGQTPEVRVGIEAEIAIAGENIQVSELIQYDVRHEDISEIQLSASGVWQPTVRLKDTAESLALVSSVGGIDTYNLPSARRGQFEILVDYFFSSSTESAEKAGVQLPLVRPAHPQQRYGSLTVATNTPEAILIDSSNGLQRVFSDDFEAAWRTEQWDSVDEIELRLLRSVDLSNPSAPSFIVMDSSVWGTRLLTSITYIFEDPAESLLFSFESAAMIERATVNNVPVSVADLSNGSTGRQIFRVPVADMTTDDSVAVVQLVVHQSFDRQHELFSLINPVFPEPVGLSESCTLLWALAQRSEQTVFEAGGHGLAGIGGVSSSGPFWQAAPRLQSTLSSLLSSYPEDVQNAVRVCVKDVSAAEQTFDLLAGNPRMDRLAIVVVSQSLVYLTMAVLGVVAYIVSFRFKGSPFVIAVAASVIVGSFAWAIAPAAVQFMLIQLLPAGVLAGLAGALQRRLMSRNDSPFRKLGDTHGNTVFAMERPAESVSLSTPSANSV